MAEQEVAKHTKKIFSVWSGKSSFWHKLREFLIEIATIVFAISLSIYLHDRSEQKHQDHETKEFLLGLKQDLQTDMNEIGEDKKSFLRSGIVFQYIAGRKMNEPISQDTIRKYSKWIFNATGLVPNSGRFEGFKSSGKIGTISNKELQNNVMDLYQEDMPSLILSTNHYTARKQKLFDFIAANSKRITDSTTNLTNILATDEAFNICSTLTYVGEIIDRYDLCIEKMKMIIEQIDKEYKE